MNYKTKGLIAICIAAFLVPFIGSAINLALPAIAGELSIKAVTLTWVSTAYLISTTIFQIPAARLADLVGRKRIFLSGISIFSLCSFISGFASSATMLITLRFLTGVGSAMMFGTNMAILTTIFPTAEGRGKALGINSAVIYASVAVAPYIGGVLTKYAGWHSIFFFSAGWGLITLVLASVMLKGEWVESRGEKFDLAGTLLYGVGIAGIIYGFSSLPGVRGVICFATGVISFLLFIHYEKRQRYPLFNIGLFKGNRVFTLSSVAALINYAATFAIAFMLSLYLQQIRGLDPGKCGLILISQACIQSLSSLAAGNLSSRHRPSFIATIGMAIIVVGLIGLIFLSETTSYLYIITILSSLGIGFGIFASPNTNVIMSSVAKRDYSQASATTGTMRLAGQAFSMGIASMAISFYIGNQPVTNAIHTSFMQSMKMTFIIFALLCSVGIYASSARIENRSNP